MIDFWLSTGFLIILVVSFKRIASFIDTALNAKVSSIKESINEAKKIKQEAQQLLFDTKRLVDSLPQKKEDMLIQMESDVEMLKKESLILHEQELKNIELDFESEMTKKEFYCSVKMKKAASGLVISSIRDFVTKQPEKLADIGIKICNAQDD